MEELLNSIMMSGFLVAILGVLVVNCSPDDVSETYKVCVLTPTLTGIAAFFTSAFILIWI